METIIIVSVLSTLGVVAILTSIVVAFIKLKNKVDVFDYHQNNDDLRRTINEVSNEIYKENDRTYNNINNEMTFLNNYNKEQLTIVHNQLDELRRLIDSRCDKLDAKIKNV